MRDAKERMIRKMRETQTSGKGARERRCVPTILTAGSSQYYLLLLYEERRFMYVIEWKLPAILMIST
jgi:hypothetical protein